MGSLYQRKLANGKLSKVWTLKYHHNGKPIRESSRSTKKMIAKKLLEQREGEIAQGKVPGVHFDKVALDELTDDLLADYRINGRKSLERAECSVKRLKEYFGDIRASSIDTPMINRYIEKRQGEKAANATINRELAALKRAFTLAIMAGKIERCPHIQKIREDNVRKGFFEYGEFIAVRDALPEYLRGLVTFAYRTGCRKAEIVNLRWKQVDRALGIVTLNPGETKNGSGRTLYLDSETKRVIGRQWDVRKQTATLSPYVFPKADGTGMIKDFRRAWLTACEKVGLSKKLFHDIRRTAVRNMVRAGVPERVAMQMSGHKTRAIFDRYNIVSDIDLKLAAERQEAYLDEKSREMGTLSGTLEHFQGGKQSRAISVSGGMKETYSSMGG